MCGTSKELREENDGADANQQRPDQLAPVWCQIPVHVVLHDDAMRLRQCDGVSVVAH